MVKQYLLLQDVDDLGHSGDLVRVKPGFARNYLVPRHLARLAGPGVLRLREKLQRERAARAAQEKAHSEALAQKLDQLSLAVTAKVDPEGHMYGSIGATEIVELIQNEGILLDRRNLAGFRPLKQLGEHAVKFKLKEGVVAQVRLVISAEGQLPDTSEDQIPPPHTVQ